MLNIGWNVRREYDNGPGPDDDQAATDWHLIESVISGAAITKCGRRLEPSIDGPANHLEQSETTPLTRMIGQPQLCGAGCYPEL